MDDDNVIDFFTREPIRPPLSNGHDDPDEQSIDEWIDEHLTPVADHFRTALDTFDAEEFRRAIHEIKVQVTDWPDP